MHIYESDLYLMKGRGGAYYLDESAYHRGGGLGSIFSSIFSRVVPYIKSAFRMGSNVVRKAASSDVGKVLKKELKKQATTAAVNVASDALKGENVLKSSKKNLKRASEGVGRKLETFGRSIENSPSSAIKVKKQRMSAKPSLTPRSKIPTVARKKKTINGKARGGRRGRRGGGCGRSYPLKKGGKKKGKRSGGRGPVGDLFG